MLRIALFLVSLALLLFHGAASAQDSVSPSGEPIVIDTRSTVPVTLELALPSANSTQVVTVAVTVDVQSMITVRTGDSVTATVVLQAAPRQQATSNTVEIVGVRVGTIQTASATIRSNAVDTDTQRSLLPAPTPASQPNVAKPDVAAESPASAVEATAKNVATVNAAANLRNGPGTGYSIVARAEPGELVTVIGRTPDGGWLQLTGHVWIAAFLVDAVPTDIAVVEDLPPLPTVAAIESTTGWRTYRLISDDAAFSYPPDWEIVDEDSNSATLESTDGNSASLIVTGSTTVIDFADSAGAIRSLKSEMADISDFEFRFLDEGALALPGSPIYVSASATYSGSTIGFLAVMAPVGSRTVTLLYMRVNQADVSAEALPLLTAMAATLVP